MKTPSFHLLLVFFMIPGFIKAQTWTFDDSHSNLRFSVTNLMVSEIEGSMKIIEADLVSAGNDFTNASVSIRADVNSIDTDHEGRDEHLRSPDFFDAAAYPDLVFRSTSFKKLSDHKYLVEGTLSFHGVTKTITLEAEATTAVRPYDDKTVVGFRVHGTIKRTDFNISTGTPSTILEDTVEIKANVIFIKDF